MGFLRRLLGGAQQAIEMNVTMVTFEHVRGDASVEVVGEQYYPANVEAFRRFSNGRAERAMLMPEPTNQYDPNAIVVLTWVAAEPTPNLVKVGHLTSLDAASYRPVFDFLNGRVIGCDAAIAPYRGGRGTHGIVLHLGTPGELMAELWADLHPFGEHPYRGQTVVFTGTGVSLAGVTLDRPAQALLARLAGVIVAPRMSKQVALCVANGGEETGASAKARSYGIPVVDEGQFWASLGVPASQLGQGLGRWAQPYSR